MWGKKVFEESYCQAFPRYLDLGGTELLGGRRRGVRHPGEWRGSGGRAGELGRHRGRGTQRP